MAKYVFENAAEAKAVYGDPKVARRKTLVRTRPVEGDSEVFEGPTDELTAVKGIDLVVVPVDGSAPYPCKVEVFSGPKGAWEETEPGSGTFRRKALCYYLDVPQGDEVVCRTLEGNALATFPDAIALGVSGEVYTYRRDWIERNLEPV